jgi:protein SCO1/2
MKCPLLFCGLLLAGSLFAAPATADPDAKSYPARGVVEQVAPGLRQVTIHHQAIPGFMMAMTMDFPVLNTNELHGIAPGDEITFTLVVTETNDWVENIRLLGHSSDVTTNAPPMAMHVNGGIFLPELKPGDLLPDYALTAEDGRQIHISDFRGQALAFTFFFTRCPLPDYCPRMNNNFQQTRKILAALPGGPTNWQFLSISFDFAYDTPSVLSNYAEVYRGDDTNRWLFAAAGTNVLADAALRLDLMVMRQGDNISHNLRTVVLDPRGRIYKQLDGNQWTPQQLAEAMAQAARL